MDKKSFIQFAVISTLIFVAWYGVMIFFGLGRARPGARPEVPPAPAEGELHAMTQGAPPAEQPVQAETEVFAVEPDIVLENSLIRTTWTNRGAALVAAQLLKYQAPYSETIAGKRVRPVLTLVREFQDRLQSDTVKRIILYGADERELSQRQTDDVVYRVVERSADRLVFERDVIAGTLRVRKTVVMPPDAYHYEVRLEFVNVGGSPLHYGFQLRGAAGIEQETTYRPAVGTIVGYRKANAFKVKEVAAGKLASAPVRNEDPNIVWAGAANRYFLAVTQPKEADWIQSVVSTIVQDSDILYARGRWAPGSMPSRQEANRAKESLNKGTVVLQSVPRVLKPAGEPGAAESFSYDFICAPKSATVLKPYEQGMSEMLSSGMLGGLKQLMTALLRFFYGIAPNYGVAILLLTVLVRVVLHPLTRSAQISAQKSQLLQPKMAELKRKHGDDRERLTREMWALQRRYGINPMKGCLPLFLQLPVFLALFQVLGTALELRQAPFISGWIDDLSQPDRTIYPLPFHWPVIWNELNVLPFLMMGVSVVSQHFTPKPADPQAQQQQMIFKWMPIVFGLLLYHMASGLLLYWTASTSIGILESWLVRRQAKDLELKPVDEQKKEKAGPREAVRPKKEGLLARLMRKIEEQQKQSVRLSAHKKKPRD